MRQTIASTTTDYPNKFYSITSTTNGATTTATTTAYLWQGDTLVATIDQLLINGTVSGTSTTSYIHPDHLGSTNIVTDSAGSVMQTLEYYPYGASRINSSTGGVDSKRKFIGQFTDSTNLSYLNARYYEGSRGQFLSQDPVFWEIGQTRDGKAVLTNPQAQNSYSYAENNPLIKKDPEGRSALWAAFYVGTQIYSAFDLGMSFGDVLSRDFIFPKNYTDRQRSESRFELGFNTVTGTAATQITDIGAKAFLNLAPAALDLLDRFRQPNVQTNTRRAKTQIKLNQTQSTKFLQNSQSVSTNYSQSASSMFSISGFSPLQMSAIKGVANAFGVSSLTSTQESAVKEVKRAFNK